MPEKIEEQFSPLPPTGIDLNELRVAMDKYYFSQAMKMAKGNETNAAKLLNMKQHTFRYQYKKIFK
jgi:DNA-binding protein Fis